MKDNMKLIMENWRKHKKLLTEESVWDAWYTKDDWDEFEVDDEGFETYPEPPEHLPALYQARTKERAEAIIKAWMEEGRELKELSGMPEGDLLDDAEELGNALGRETPSEEIADAAEEAVKMIKAGFVPQEETPEDTIKKVLKQFSPEEVEALENSYRSEIKDPNDPRGAWSLEDAVRHTVENTGATAEELISSLKNQLTRGL
jgi:hypothetical protein